VALESPGMDALFDRAKERKIIPGYRLDKLDKSYGNKILISITEKKTKSDIDALVEVFTS
jgi:glycine cleavage system pyridoxal-binding protein P